MTRWSTPFALTPVRGRVTVPVARAGHPDAVDRWADPADATCFLAAAAVTTGTVLVRNWPHLAGVPDRVSVAAEMSRTTLAAMGTYVVRNQEGLTCTSRASSGELVGAQMDLGADVRLAPVFAALAALGRSPSRLSGLPSWLGAQLTANLRALGADVRQEGRHLAVYPAALTAGEWRSFDSRFMVIAAAVLGLRVAGVVVDDITPLRAQLPGFQDSWAMLMAAGTHLLPGTSSGHDQ